MFYRFTIARYGKTVKT